jgi:hypothetical protein
MKVGDTVRFSKKAVRVYGFTADVGLVVAMESYPGHSQSLEHTRDYRILINGKVELVGSQIDAEGHVEVIA